MQIKFNNSSALRKLLKNHPDWTYEQYADELGTTVSSVRGALSRMGLSRKSNGRPRKVQVEEERVKAKAEPPKYYVASRSGPRQGSYLKLM